MSHRKVKRAGGRRRALLLLAWFPPAEWEEALRRWPDLEEECTRDYHVYTWRLEKGARQLRTLSRGRVGMAPIQVTDYLEWCQAGELDPGDAASRTEYALRPGGGFAAWPPAADQPCWCRSGVAYAGCHGTPTGPGKAPFGP